MHHLKWRYLQSFYRSLLKECRRPKLVGLITKPLPMAQNAIYLPDAYSLPSPAADSRCRLSSSGEGQKPAFGLLGSRLARPLRRRTELKSLLRRRHRHHKKMMAKNKRLSGKTGTDNGRLSALKVVMRRSSILVARPTNMATLQYNS